YIHNGQLTEDDYIKKLGEVDALVDDARVIDIDRPLLFAASRRLPVRLATLDAIHLATAERFRYRYGARRPFVFATHDRELASAARAAGFDVIGFQLESGA
ncbi:MAG TPA: hypothetical protein VG323_05605, partial [Thermoanaerobaculia bacterium]|nr:hypothetical protein [Thermoanaerobaculia bacterium]